MDIKEIADKAGGVVALSTGLGLSRGAVSQWQVVPDGRVLAVCALTNWQITPHQARPDLYPNPGDALPPGVLHDHPAPTGTDQEPATPLGEFGEPRSGLDRRDDERRNLADSEFGLLGEPRDGDRRQEDRRRDGGENEASA